MKFKKMLVYDFRGATHLSEKLRPFCEEMVILNADKDFSDEMKPENLIGIDAFVAKPFGDYNKTFLAKADSLKYFGLVSTSYSVVDVEFLKSRGVTFTNVPHYSTESVAELTISVLLEIARHLNEAMDQARKNYTGKRRNGWELSGKTIGIIGLGNVGTRVAEIAKCLGMNVVYYSKIRKPEIEAKLGIKYTGIDDLLKCADVVSLHCALNYETKQILNKERLAMLKDGAVILNSARSELCDLDAVADLARNDKIIAWFDALDDEEQRNKLFEIQNIIATPHIGWITIEAQKRLDEMAVENVRRFIDGKPINVIDSK